MAISFNQIPSTVGLPGSYIELDSANARRGQAGKPYRIAVYGQMSPAYVPVTNVYGSTTPANIPVQVSSAAQAKTLFGAGSILYAMAQDLFKTNSVNEAWFIPQLDDGAGVARVVELDYALVYTQPSIVTGVERVYIGDREYRVAVALGGTAATVSAALAAAINADEYALFNATAATGKLTLTAKAKGEVMNDVQIVAQYNVGDASPAGTFVTVAQTTAGTQNPSIAAGIASASTMDVTHVVVPYNDATNAALILAEALDRWAPLPGATSLGNGQEDFVIFGAYRGTEAQFTTFMSTRNSEYRTTAHIEPGQTIGGVQYAGLMSSAFQFAAAYAALSAGLTSVVANNPHQNRVLACLKPAPMVTRFPWNVRNRVVLNQGGATYKYNDAGQVLLETATTERTTTDTGVATDAERRLETQFAKSFIRWSTRTMLETQFPNSRLADDGTAGLPNNVVTPKILKGAIIALAKNVWVPAGIIENFKDFVDSLIVERSTEDCNTIKFQMFPDLVNILTIKAGKLSYIVC